MAKDARFEETARPEQALRLKAECGDDLSVISALLQDAIGQTGMIAWAPKRRRLVLILNRFRWEDRDRAEREKRAYERVQTVLSLSDVTKVRARGLDPADPETIFSILSIAFEPGEDCAGTVRMVLAGDGELAADVECLDMALADLSQPWQAEAKAAPSHNA